MSEKKSNSGEENKPKKTGGKFSKPSAPKFNFNFYWIYGLAIVIILVLQVFDTGNKPRDITWNQF